MQTFMLVARNTFDLNFDPKKEPESDYNCLNRILCVMK